MISYKNLTAKSLREQLIEFFRNEALDNPTVAVNPTCTYDNAFELLVSDGPDANRTFEISVVMKRQPKGEATIVKNELTDKEHLMLDAIMKSDYQDGAFDPNAVHPCIGRRVWSNILNHNLGRGAGGVMASLQKKGLVIVSEYEKDQNTVEMTEAGYRAWALRHPVEAAADLAKGVRELKENAIPATETPMLDAAREQALREDVIAERAKFEAGVEFAKQAGQIKSAAIEPEAPKAKKSRKPKATKSEK